MKREQLIKSLSDKSGPFQSLASPYIRFSKWLAAVVFCLSIGVLLFGLRNDLESASRGVLFQIHGMLTIVLALASSLSAFLLSVPGRHGRITIFVPMATLALLFVYFLYSIFFLEPDPLSFGWNCIRDILVLAFIPGGILFFLLRSAAVLDGWKTGFFATVGLAAFGSLGTQFICSNDGPLHTLLWHYLPIILLGIFGSWIGGKFLKIKISKDL